ncbi:MAG TPA: hypothetical protein VFI08_05650 [Spirochaetia bacterium]|nr:hypothetical protein [Spirochaetia bacterium]
MTMVIICIVLFAVAAVFGLINLTRVVGAGRAPRATVYIHGAVAAAALVLLVVYSVLHAQSAPIVALILFIVAALGGFTLFGIDVATQKPPKWLAFVHGVVAVAGFVFLLVAALSGAGAA